MLLLFVAVYFVIVVVVYVFVCVVIVVVVDVVVCNKAGLAPTTLAQPLVNTTCLHFLTYFEVLLVTLGYFKVHLGTLWLSKVL